MGMPVFVAGGLGLACVLAGEFFSVRPNAHKILFRVGFALQLLSITGFLGLLYCA